MITLIRGDALSVNGLPHAGGRSGGFEFVERAPAFID